MIDQFKKTDSYANLNLSGKADQLLVQQGNINNWLGGTYLHLWYRQHNVSVHPFYHPQDT